MRGRGRRARGWTTPLHPAANHRVRAGSAATSRERAHLRALRERAEETSLGLGEREVLELREAEGLDGVAHGREHAQSAHQRPVLLARRARGVYDAHQHVYHHDRRPHRQCVLRAGSCRPDGEAERRAGRREHRVRRHEERERRRQPGLLPEHHGEEGGEHGVRRHLGDRLCGEVGDAAVLALGALAADDWPLLGEAIEGPHRREHAHRYHAVREESHARGHRRRRWRASLVEQPELGAEDHRQAERRREAQDVRRAVAHVLQQRALQQQPEGAHGPADAPDRPQARRLATRRRRRRRQHLGRRRGQRGRVCREFALPCGGERLDAQPVLGRHLVVLRVDGHEVDEKLGGGDAGRGGGVADASEVGEGVLRRAAVDDVAAGRHQDDVVDGEPDRAARLVQRRHHGAAPRHGERAEKLDDALGLERVESGGRLVGEDGAWHAAALLRALLLPRDRAGHREPPALAARDATSAGADATLAHAPG